MFILLDMLSDIKSLKGDFSRNNLSYTLGRKVLGSTFLLEDLYTLKISPNTNLYMNYSLLLKLAVHTGLNILYDRLIHYGQYSVHLSCVSQLNRKQNCLKDLDL